MPKQEILLLLTLAVVSAFCTKLTFRPHSEEVKLSSKKDCPDKSKCSDNNTCCEVPSGKFACCDLPEAVCCADKLHCCPKETSCDIEHNKCVHSSGLTTNWHRHEEEAEEEVVHKVALVEPKIQICPDNKSFCSDDETCCLLPGEMYGCCPVPKAVCCEDKEHCCPLGTICNVSHSSCDHSDPNMIKIPWLEKQSSLDFRTDMQVQKVKCKDGKSYCEDGQTCCALPDGRYGCCPYPKAVCCSDMVHCCPDGFKCNEREQTCIKVSVAVPSSRKLESSDLSTLNGICPDGRTSCGVGQTCCALFDGSYSCCPYPSAVCCSDWIHCCPHGYTCDITSQYCVKGPVTIPSSVKLESTKLSANVSRVVCPDHASYCQDGQTCCLLLDGNYGCCPYPKAVCCSDRVHCCPNGFKCDPSGQTCSEGSLAVASSTKLESMEPLTVEKRVICPDKRSYCQTGQTCCILDDGSYGCCPDPNAVCCDDKIHCCPNGYTCDSSGENCDKGSLKVPSSVKLKSTELKAKEKKYQIVICLDGSICYDRQTCCLQQSGKYGCCPFESAVCCSDRIHCCPQGYGCSASGKLCIKSPFPLPSSDELVSMKLSRVVCPDRLSYCADGQTCCLLLDGNYGCCPYPKAVCCDDKIHCCPNGYTCDSSGENCEKGSIKVPSSVKLKSSELKAKEKIVVCPNGAFCFDGQTCCLQRSGAYGCCPYAFAVCCWDNIHCCPYGYWCDPSGAQCFRGLERIPSSDKLQAFGPSMVDNRKVCPDQTSYCQDTQTCCLLPNGTYGCCQYTWAVCCADKMHCCPNGFRCDSTGQYCLRGDSIALPSSDKLPSTRLSGFKKNECCKDKKDQCCPQGFQCNEEGDGCVPESEEKIPMMEASGKVRCDNWTFCLEHQTCCKGPDDSFKCCPLEGASCCKDGINCCHHWCVPLINKCFPNVRKTYLPEPKEEPTKTVKAEKVNWCNAARTLYCHEGFVCDTSDTTCKRQRAKVDPLGNGIRASPLSHVCPSWVSKELKRHCQHGETCCLAGKSEHFVKCCPYKDAVCCNGGSYCCPSGSTCDDSKNMCKSNDQEFWVGMSEMRSPDSVGREPRTPRVVEDVQCGDNSSCPDETTCCQQVDGHFTCCQFKNAVCCKDHIHCCPKGYKCDLTSQSCTVTSPEDGFEFKTPMDFHARTLSKKGPIGGGGRGVVECRGSASADPTHSCPAGHRCCFGDFGNEEPVCCLDDGSVCCDGFCCPPGQRCGTEKGTCLG